MCTELDVRFEDLRPAAQADSAAAAAGPDHDDMCHPDEPLQVFPSTCWPPPPAIQARQLRATASFVHQSGGSVRCSGPQKRL
jgi:hypothetical protein